MGCAVDLSRGECLGIGSGQIKHHAIFIGAIRPVLFINSAWTNKFIHAPPRDRLGTGNGLGGWALGYLDCFARFTGHFFKQLNTGFHNPWFSRSLQAGRAAGPGVVSTQDMLFRWRDVAFGTIGQVKSDGGLQGTVGLLLEATQRIHLIGNASNSYIANANGL